MVEAGFLIKEGILKSLLRVGDVARIMESTRVGQGAPQHAVVAKELLPLPLILASAEEANIRSALSAGATLIDIKEDFKRSLRLVCREAWLFRLVLVVNSYCLGNAVAKKFESGFPNCATPAQAAAVQRREKDVAFFLEEAVSAVPDVDWGRYQCQADSESTFIAKCGSDGKFSGIKKCQPVFCSASISASGADTSHDTDKFSEETAEWECQEGYAVDGTRHGGTAFKQQCLASGSYGTSMPYDCTDINFCVGDRVLHCLSGRQVRPARLHRHLRGGCDLPPRDLQLAPGGA